MKHLEAIIADNNARVAKCETAFTRHCSHVEQPDKSVILHSALQRSTGFLDSRRGRAFLALAVVASGSPDASAYDRLVEGYF